MVGCRSLIGKDFLMSSIVAYGAGLICSLTMSSEPLNSVTLPFTWKRTRCASIPTTTSASRLQVMHTAKYVYIVKYQSNRTINNTEYVFNKIIHFIHHMQHKYECKWNQLNKLCCSWLNHEFGQILIMFLLSLCSSSSGPGSSAHWNPQWISSTGWLQSLHPRKHHLPCWCRAPEQLHTR